jgi:hypothetical protein
VTGGKQQEKAKTDSNTDLHAPVHQGIRIVNQEQIPTIDELSYTPELAALAALDFTIEAATRALLAAHPELCEDQIPRTKLVAVIHGHRLLHMASKTQVALARYRQAVAPKQPLPPDATDGLDELSAET